MKILHLSTHGCSVKKKVFSIFRVQTASTYSLTLFQCRGVGHPKGLTKQQCEQKQTSSSTHNKSFHCVQSSSTSLPESTVDLRD